jgi:hypothetical protein
VKEADRRRAYVASARGGSLSRVTFEDAGKTNRSAPSPRHGGGPRGPVKGLSKASRLTLLRKFAAIDRTALAALSWRILFVGLTYPQLWPEDPQVSKGHLKAFRKRLERKYGPFSAYWRLGIQMRGAWHYHVIVYAPPSFGSLEEVRSFVSSSWHAVTGELSEGHLRTGSRVEVVRSWKRAPSFAERYLARMEEFPPGAVTGRVWGAWHEALLPIEWETVEVDPQAAYRVRRVFRKLAKIKGTGSLRELRVFVKHDDVVRLVKSLGYDFG